MPLRMPLQAGNLQCMLTAAHGSEVESELLGFAPCAYSIWIPLGPTIWTTDQMLVAAHLSRKMSPSESHWGKTLPETRVLHAGIQLQS